MWHQVSPIIGVPQMPPARVRFQCFCEVAVLIIEASLNRVYTQCVCVCVCVCRDTAGQERFETLTAQYYRRAQGIILVYDITSEQSFGNVSKWLRNIEEVREAGLL